MRRGGGWGGVKSYQPSALGSSGQRKFKERKVRIKENLTQKAIPEEVEHFKHAINKSKKPVLILIFGLN